MAGPFTVEKILMTISRNERRYCIFTVHGSSYTFMYFSHVSRPLRSLFFGNDFLEKVSCLPKNGDLCIECSLGTAIAGGVSLDGDDCISHNCSVATANQVISSLADLIAGCNPWIKPF